MASLTDELNGTQANLATATSDLEGKSAELESFQASSESEAQALASQLADLQAALDNANSDLGTSAQTLADREQELQSSADRLADLEQQLADAKQQAADLQQRLDAAAAEIASRNAAVDQDAATSSELRDKIAASLAANGVEDPQVTVRDDNSVVVNLRSEALFSSGRARLSAQGRALMGNVGNALNGMDNTIRVEGHTDSIPVSGDLLAIFPSNWELSVARAANTVNYLQNRAGVDANRLSAVGYGEFRPVATNGTRAGRAQNRRVEIVVMP